MERHKNAANMNLPVALVRVRLDVNVIVVYRKHSAGDCVMAAHPIPDLDLLAIFNEPL